MTVRTEQAPNPVAQPPEFFDTYHSVFEYRYGSDGMRAVWSENNKWRQIRKIWVEAARVQNRIGLVSDEELADLEAHQDEIDVGRIYHLEREIGHDVVAAITEFSEKAPIGGRILHQGMTSEDPLSNGEIMQSREALGIIETKLKSTLGGFAGKIEENKDLVCLGFTHLQAAEPTTVGYRLARYAQDLLLDLRFLRFVNEEVKGKGIKGAVGTSASFQELLEGIEISVEEHEAEIMRNLGIESVLVSDQTYPRKFNLLVAELLANIGQSLHRFALDVQILQSSPFDEWAEPRRRRQVGSSAMPHKANPIQTENIDSLTEELPGVVFSTWMTAAFQTLERTLRDSANKRRYLPEAFLIVDEALKRTERVVRGLVIRETSIGRNLRQFGPFVASEILLARLGRAGANRQEMHELLREHCGQALEAVRQGQTNPLETNILEDLHFTNYLCPEEIKECFQKVYAHIGNVPAVCERLVKEIRDEIGEG